MNDPVMQYFLYPSHGAPTFEIAATLSSDPGIPAAIGAGKLMTHQLFGVKPWDPIMLALAALMLSLAALLASAIPARRAAGVEPMVALRNG